MSSYGVGETAVGRRRIRFGGRTTGSIRTVLLVIVLVPSVALAIVGVSVVVLLGTEARTAGNWADYRGNLTEHLVGYVAAVQEERTTGLAAIGGDAQAVEALLDSRSATDAALAEMKSIVSSAHAPGADPEAIEGAVAGFGMLVDRLPAIRGMVDSGRGDATEVDGFYTAMVDVIATTNREIAADSAANAPIANEELASVDILEVADLQSRTVGLAASGMAQGALDSDKRRAVARVAGAYRDQFGRLASRLTEQEQIRLQGVSASGEWKAVLAAEDALVETGTLPIPYEDWRAAEQTIRKQLLDVYIDHTNYALALTEDFADRLFMQAAVAGIVVALISSGATAVSVVLANRLIRRLRRLRANSLDLAYKKLPSIIDRIHGGESVDVEAETAPVDRERDEIGDVAQAFAIAQRTAVTAAVAEAGTREGFNRVFLDIAHRSQVVVRRQLDILEVAENKQDDPEHLELLFKLDHLATRSRRNSENLLILGGAQPGRKWREPVELEDIVRSAISETEEFLRVSAVRLPRVRIVGTAVADLIHLLAELVDNAASFSPPAAPVAVRGNLVGRGAVVEVEDQGLGIRVEERDRLNQLLSTPPEFTAMALSGQRHLGLFVVGQLARRHALSVTLQESAYGGVKAVVLIPADLMEPATDPAPEIERDRGIPVPESRTGQFTRSHSASNHALSHGPGTTGIGVVPNGMDSVSRGVESAVCPAEPTPSPPPVRRNVAPATRPLQPGSGQVAPSARGKRRPLPQRQRQASLAPQLRQDLPTFEGSESLSEQAPADGRAQRDAGRARRALSSFQQGTRRARTAPTNSTHWNGWLDSE